MEDVEECCEMLSSRCGLYTHHSCDYLHTTRLKISQHSSADGQGAYEVSLPAEKLLVIGGCLERNFHFSSGVWLLVGYPYICRKH